MQVKVLAVDIDGTLTDEKRHICIEAIQAIREARDNGYPVILASGHILPIIFGLQGFLGLKGNPIVAENGGVVLHNRKITRLASNELALKAYQYISQRMEVSLLWSDIWRETEVGIDKKANIDELKRHLWKFDTDGELKVESTGFAHHIFDCRMNKFEGLKVAAGMIGVDVADFGAVGDSENDVQMLKGCGVGVALANAQDIAKDAADHVTKESYGSGFQEALQYLGVI
jgi:phosphoglycolate phosphatase (TIGR01487 family)